MGEWSPRPPPDTSGPVRGGCWCGVYGVFVQSHWAGIYAPVCATLSPVRRYLRPPTPPPPPPPNPPPPPPADGGRATPPPPPGTIDSALWGCGVVGGWVGEVVGVGVLVHVLARSQQRSGTRRHAACACPGVCRVERGGNLLRRPRRAPGTVGTPPPAPLPNLPKQGRIQTLCGPSTPRPPPMGPGKDP